MAASTEGSGWIKDDIKNDALGKERWFVKMGLFGFLMQTLRFRKKVTTREKLQHIDEELEKLDVRLKSNQQLQKSITVYLITLAVLIYIVSIIVVYLWYLPALWMERFLYIVPFLIFPFIIYIIKRLLHQIFINRIRHNANAAKELKKDKKKILETVMDTETYKVAKELLQKYDPNGSLVEEIQIKEKTMYFQRCANYNAKTVSPIKGVPKATSEGQELRRRNVQTTNPPSKPSGPLVPIHASSNGYSMPPAPRLRSIQAPGIRAPVGMMRDPAPRAPVPIGPILPRERSVFDKVADYFIGDGPSNRFALICKNCHGHNGMVLAEEFEFTSYRCCYCGFFNTARKQRLNAPRLERISHNRSRNGSTNSTDVESSTKGDETDEKVDSSVESNTVFDDENTTKTSDDSTENDETIDTTTDEPSDDIELETETKELYSTQDIVDNESSEKLETVETEEKKEDG